jgi:hypothetical protein
MLSRLEEVRLPAFGRRRRWSEVGVAQLARGLVRFANDINRPAVAVLIQWLAKLL